MKDQEIENLPFPEGWIEVTVGDVSEKIQYGYTCSSCEEPIGPRFLRITDIQNGKVNWNHVPYCEIQEDKFPNFRLNPGDIVFARTGATAGKSFLIKDCPEAIFASYLIRIIPSNKIEGRYLQYYFQTQDYWRQISENIAGIAQPNCNASKLKELHLPLPPLEEQQRIVAKIEKLLARVDATKERLDRVPAIMQQFRQSVLAAACSGRLTERWREIHISNIEPKAYFDEVITFSKQLKNNRRTNNNKKIEPKTDEILGNWMYFYGHQIFPFITSGSRGWAKYYSDDGYAFIRIGNLTRDSINIDLSNIQKVTPPESAERNRIRVKENDILISITADIGSIGLVTKEIPESYINQHIAIARPLPNVNSKYLSYFLLSPNGGKIQFQNLQRGATKIGLGLDDIRSLKIPIPPIEEQLEIVHKIGILFAHAIRIEEQVTAARERVETITQSILHQAFTGKLVSQESITK